MDSGLNVYLYVLHKHRYLYIARFESEKSAHSMCEELCNCVGFSKYSVRKIDFSTGTGDKTALFVRFGEFFSDIESVMMVKPKRFRWESYKDFVKRNRKYECRGR